jgi:GNAT superfamily N-acetyltransferase
MEPIKTTDTAAPIEIGVEPADSPDALRCVAAYFRELEERFEHGFDPGSGGYAGGVAKDGAKGCFLIARRGGQAVGCGELKALDAQTGEIKRMWIAPDARGHGLARRLLDALEEKARGLGMRRVRLDTNRTLKEAQALYRKAGYREIGRYNDNLYADFFFEKELDQLEKSRPISR